MTGGVPRAGRRAAWGIDGFSFGMALSGGGGDETWREDLLRARRAEEFGFHSLWVPEMHFARGACSAPVVALFALAAATRRIRLATTSLLLPIHDADALARDLSLLWRTSGERLIVGLGRGFRPALFRAFGVDAASKRARFDAALDRMLEIWRDEGIAPPLAVAAFGPKGLRQAASRGLPYLPSMIESLETLEQNFDAHAAALPEGGLRDDLVVPALRTVHVAATDGEARRVLESLDRGSEAEARRRALPRAVARAAEASARTRVIVGTAAAVVDQIGTYRERVGLDLLIVAPPFSGVSAAERDASLERLAGEVAPQLRGPAPARRPPSREGPTKVS